MRLVLCGVALALISLSVAVASSADEQIADYLSVSPEEVRHEQRCAQNVMPVIYGESLTAKELDGRYHYVKRQGRNNGMLIEFADRCPGLLQGPKTNAPLTNRCVGELIFFDYHPVCQVENLYRAPNAKSARALALRLEVDRARETGMTLPDDPVAAAEAFVAAQNTSPAE